MKIEKEMYFTLYSSIIPVKGANRSIICDLDKRSYRFISNDLSDILLNNSNVKIKKIYNDYSTENHSVIDEMFNFLIHEDYLFLSKTPSNIAKLKFNRPFYSEQINNAIIDINSTSNFNMIEKFIKELDVLRCKNISIRFFGEKINRNDVLNILNLFYKTTIRYIELTIHSDIFTIHEFDKLLAKYIRLNIVFVYNHNVSRVYDFTKEKKIITSTLKNIDSSSCGKVNKKYFKADSNMFSLNMNVNSCLYGKVSLTSDGHITNCPSLSKKYKTITDTTIESVVNKKSFKKLWFINKDQINVCRDCEFRYICSDCRAFLNDNFDKPFKCNYNPYESKWTN